MCNKQNFYFKHVLQNHYFNKSLSRLGIETKYIGFYYLSNIMDELINNQISVHSFSRQVYPALAEKYNKSDLTIERDIRNLIAVKWETNLKNKLSHYWFKEYPPSCCQFIRIIKHYLIDYLIWVSFWRNYKWHSAIFFTIIFEFFYFFAIFLHLCLTLYIFFSTIN